MKIKISVQRIVLFLIIAATLTFIWSNSFADAPTSTGRSNTVIRILKPIIDPGGRISAKLFTMLIRKAAHFTEFAALGIEFLLLFMTFEKIRSAPRTVLLLPVLPCLLCAVADECIQLFSSGRACRLTDVLIDVSGSVTGILAVLCIGFVVKKLRLVLGTSKKRQ